MAVPRKPSLFHLTFLTGDKPLLTLDDEFLRNHTKVLLISDTSDRLWEVKLDGNRLAGGWDEFAAVHNFRDGEVLIFRHSGDEIFDVSVPSRYKSSDRQHASPSFIDTYETEDDDDSSESDESEDVEDEDNDEDVDDDDDDAEDSLVNKNKKPEADSSSSYSCFLRARVTPSSLNTDRLDLPKDFKVMSFNEHKKPFEIYLANEKGRKWTLILSRNSSIGVFYIRRGWVNFCSANGLRQDDICSFKLSENGERPVLLLCSHESGNGHEDKEECPEADAVKICSVGGCSKEKRTLDEVSKGKEKNTPHFLTVKLTANRFKTGQLYMSSVFMSKSGIKECGEITLLDKDGRKWPSYIQTSGQGVSEWSYLRKGWREMCKANGIKVNDSFMLELIWEDAKPIFMFHSKIEHKGKGNKRARKKRACETVLRTVEKTRGVEIDGRKVSKRGRTRVSDRPNTSSRKLQRTQLESCSVSDQVANVKRSILDTLNTVRHFLAELETREKNLEASLLEVDALGERILGISQILNNTLV